MSRWKNNAPYPGTQLDDLRFIRPGAEFSVPDDTPARELWIPLDPAAHAAVERAKAACDRFVKEQAREAGATSTPQIRRFRTASGRIETPAEPGDRPEDRRVDKDEAVLAPSQARKTL